MSHPKQVEQSDLLRSLLAANVEFIVVGGGAVVLHGCPVQTLDLDIVPRQTEENAERLLALLDGLDVFVIEPMNRRLKPERDWFLRSGQINLSTRLGPLDVLCRLHDGRGYDDLLAHSVEMTDDEHRLWVLDVPTLIEVKSAAGRPRDRIALPYLLALHASGIDSSPEDR